MRSIYAFQLFASNNHIIWCRRESLGRQLAVLREVLALHDWPIHAGYAAKQLGPLIQNIGENEFLDRLLR